VSPRGESPRLARALVDFGADHAFAPAAAKVQEHYGVEVPVSRGGRKRGQSLLFDILGGRKKGQSLLFDILE